MGKAENSRKVTEITETASFSEKKGKIEVEPWSRPRLLPSLIRIKELRNIVPGLVPALSQAEYNKQEYKNESRRYRERAVGKKHRYAHSLKWSRQIK